MSSTFDFEPRGYSEHESSGHLEISPKRFSVEAYHKLAELGILSQDDRVELLEGVISPKMIHSPIHDAVVSAIEHVLRPQLDVNHILRIQSSITLDRSEPEPDLAVAFGPPLRYMERHPCGQDLALVIEVAETSVHRDRVKAASYASAGIPVYWIINLKQRRLELFQSPKGDEYAERLLLQTDDAVNVLQGFRSAASIRVSDLIPKLGG